MLLRLNERKAKDENLGQFSFCENSVRSSFDLIAPWNFVNGANIFCEIESVSVLLRNALVQWGAPVLILAARTLLWNLYSILNLFVC